MDIPPPPNRAGGGAVPPPPYRAKGSQYGKQKKKGGCYKCICCCYFFLFILIIVSAVLLFCFYTFYNPQVPSYEVQGLDVKTFDVQHDFSLKTEIMLTIKAYNPNKALGFIYSGENSIKALYNGSSICSGKLPGFSQGIKNTTMLNVLLSGKSEFGSGLQEAMMENKHNGRIPLVVKVKEPVRVVVFEVPLRQFVVYLNCSLVLDNLAPKKKVKILSSKYDVSWTL